ncbi:hypothetical protein GGR58DRAFT_524031 [Xylaria digitata]|nr:hypothetical protein GGR58DRAFT_524031 [Xylaria digitata]
MSVIPSVRELVLDHLTSSAIAMFTTFRKSINIITAGIGCDITSMKDESCARRCWRLSAGSSRRSCATRRSQCRAMTPTHKMSYIRVSTCEVDIERDGDDTHTWDVLYRGPQTCREGADHEREQGRVGEQGDVRHRALEGGCEVALDDARELTYDNGITFEHVMFGITLPYDESKYMGPTRDLDPINDLCSKPAKKVVVLTGRTRSCGEDHRPMNYESHPNWEPIPPTIAVDVDRYISMVNEERSFEPALDSMVVTSKTDETKLDLGAQLMKTVEIAQAEFT